MQTTLYLKIDTEEQFKDVLSTSENCWVDTTDHNIFRIAFENNRLKCLCFFLDEGIMRYSQTGTLSSYNAKFVTESQFIQALFNYAYDYSNPII